MKEVNGYTVFTTDELAKILKEHAEWLVDSAKGERANLSWANLSGADIDYASFPFHCGGSNFKCSAKLVYQFLAHVYTFNPSDKAEEKEFEEIKKLIKPFAKKSHRWNDLVRGEK